MDFNEAPFREIVDTTNLFLLKNGLISPKSETESIAFSESTNKTISNLIDLGGRFIEFGNCIKDNKPIKLRLSYNPSWLSQIYLYGLFDKEIGAEWKNWMKPQFPDDFHFQFMPMDMAGLTIMEIKCGHDARDIIDRLNSFHRVGCYCLATISDVQYIMVSCIEIDDSFPKDLIDEKKQLPDYIKKEAHRSMFEYIGDRKIKVLDVNGKLFFEIIQ